MMYLNTNGNDTSTYSNDNNTNSTAIVYTMIYHVPAYPEEENVISELFIFLDDAHLQYLLMYSRLPVIFRKIISVNIFLFSRKLMNPFSGYLPKRHREEYRGK